jgi:hypothetical protein
MGNSQCLVAGYDGGGAEGIKGPVLCYNYLAGPVCDTVKKEYFYLEE